MRSILLAQAARVLTPLLLVFSVFLLLRGHNLPGGGFVGGLVASAAIVLHAMERSLDDARRLLRMPPRAWITLGLAVAGLSGLPGMIAGRPFMTGAWLGTPLPVLGRLGTPVLFDVGVYLLVIGVVTSIVLELMEE